MTKRIVSIQLQLTGKEYFDASTGIVTKPSLEDDIQLALDIINYAINTNDSDDVESAKFYITEGKEIVHLSETITPSCDK